MAKVDVRHFASGIQPNYLFLSALDSDGDFLQRDRIYGDADGGSLSQTQRDLSQYARVVFGG